MRVAVSESPSTHEGGTAILRSHRTDALPVGRAEAPMTTTSTFPGLPQMAVQCSACRSPSDQVTGLDGSGQPGRGIDDEG